MTTDITENGDYVIHYKNKNFKLMVTRNRIWNELKQAKANILCLQRYTDNRRRNNRIYYACIAIVSSLGALINSLWSGAAFTATLIIAFVSITKSVMPSFLQTEPELSELDKLSDFYSNYMNVIEKIWFDYDHEYVNEELTMKRFFEIKESECSKQSLFNKGVRGISKSMQNKIDNDAENYINEVYFTIDNDE